MSEEFSSILESEDSNKSHFDKRVSFKLIQMILGSAVVFMTSNNMSLVYSNSKNLPSTYPAPDAIFVFRQQFTLGFAITCIIYALLLTFFFFLLKSSDTSDEEESLDLELRKRRFLRTNKLITKASIVVDIFLMIFWTAVTSGFLFPISDNDYLLDIKSISCQAAHDTQVANQKPWNEVCNGCQSLILIGYTICVSFLFSGVYSMLYLAKKSSN